MTNTVFDITGKHIWVAGSRGLVGSAITRRLQGEDVVLVNDPHKDDLDLRDQSRVREWMGDHKIDVVILAAAKVGGIEDNRMHPADFITDNLQIQTNVIGTAAALDVQKLVFLGSSCIYPKHAAQPIQENALLSGALEDTNRAYAIAKIAGIETVRAMRRQYGRDFISVMPCNLYGPNDQYGDIRAHVIPALISKINQAKSSGAGAITIWGSGTPVREFMHADDAADAIVFALRRYSGEDPLNIGTGEEITITALAQLLCDKMGFTGDIVCDESKPDGTMRKVLDSSRIYDLGWRPKISLSEGLSKLVNAE